jgi:hypothetical protein
MGVGYALYLSFLETSVVIVKGVIGSEKEAFFRDPRVIAALKDVSLQVEFDKAGSRDIATKFNLKNYDFAFPAGMPAAEKIRRDNNIVKSYPVFFTPMAIASWTKIVKILEDNKIVEKKANAYFVVDMPRLLDLVKQRKRWNELPQNTSFPVGRSILINSTDVRTSNSAAQYLSLASYLYNGTNVVSSDQQIAPILNDLVALFARQGFTSNSTEEPFEEYLAQGMGKAPLVMIYEAQFLRAKAQTNSPITDDMVLLYPEPTVFTKHVVVPLNKKGERLGEALTVNPALKRLAIEHGFRNDSRVDFQTFVKRNALNVPEEIVSVAEVPSYEILERMIVQIEDSYKNGSH